MSKQDIQIQAITCGKKKHHDPTIVNHTAFYILMKWKKGKKKKKSNRVIHPNLFPP